MKKFCIYIKGLPVYVLDAIEKHGRTLKKDGPFNNLTMKCDFLYFDEIEDGCFYGVSGPLGREQLTLEEFFALKPEPVWPRTFKDSAFCYFSKDRVEINHVCGRVTLLYSEIDTIKKHADEIRQETEK